jgi:hypothetical protein
MTATVWLILKDPVKRAKDQFYLVLGLFCVPLYIWLSWVEWTTRIVTDELGIRWKGGGLQGQSRWEEISGLGFQRRPGTPEEPRADLKVGLVDGASGDLHLLPFLSRELYEVLKTRYPALPSEIEAEWFSQPRGADKGMNLPLIRSKVGFSGLLNKMVESSSHWTCFKCGEINHPRLGACGKCSYPR